MMPGEQPVARESVKSKKEVEEEQQKDDDEDQEDDGATENILQPGKKISLNDFQLLTVVGRGSFGKVYLVRHKDSSTPYAMKILKKDQLIKKNLLIKTQGKSTLTFQYRHLFFVYS